MRTTPPIYKYSGIIAGFGLASLIIGLIVLITLKDVPKLASWMILALGVLLLITAAVLDFTKVKGAVTGRRGRFSAGNTVMVSIFVGIIIVVNAISVNYYGRYDVTELAQFTLTSQTKNYLAGLEIPVTAICFFTPNDSYGIGTYASSLLEEYKNYTDKLTVKTIDPDEYPDEAKKYSISQYQTVVFESELGVRSVPPENIYTEAEHAFTGAILEVTGVVQKTVYFLTGHGEAAITGEYAYATQTLMDNLYKVNSLDLMVEQAVPDDCAVLIVAGPRTSFTALENRIIRDYLNNNGSMLVMINPEFSEDMRTLLAEWYLDVEDGTVIDPSAYWSTISNPIIPRTQNEFGLTEVYFPGAVALTPNNPPEDKVLMVPILYTSALTWVEKNYVADENPQYNESIETLGSRAIGVLVMEALPENAASDAPFAQMIVLGDSDFASNQHFYNGDNAYQFLNMVVYLTSDTDLGISVERKVLPYRSLIITKDQETLIRVLSVALLPILVLLGGAVVWWRRR
jgi:ABC-type uncharacterized transport system involved in gliding motility auxiliary subunit